LVHDLYIALAFCAGTKLGNLASSSRRSEKQKKILDHLLACYKRDCIRNTTASSLLTKHYKSDLDRCYNYSCTKLPLLDSEVSVSHTYDYGIFIFLFLDFYSFVSIYFIGRSWSFYRRMV